VEYDFRAAVDLTQELVNGMPIYAGNPVPSFSSFKTLDRDRVNLTSLVLGSHTGTHIDAPRHFISDGMTVDEIAPSRLIGEAYVADLSSKQIGSGIAQTDLESKLEGNVKEDDIVICYTGCSDHWGDPKVSGDYTYLTEEAAEYLVSKKIRAVGIDFLSVEKFKSPTPAAHKVILGGGLFIIESISSAVKQFLGARVLLICLPIKLQGGDGAPARVLAVPIIPPRIGATPQ
jgi:arylformamidase